MFIRDIISEEVPPLKTTDTGLKALGWMEEFKVSHLPVVDGMEFIGLVTENDILDMNDPDQPLINHPMNMQNPSVRVDQHVYDAIRVAAGLDLTLVPVLDENKKFLGVITLPTLIKKTNDMLAISDPGGIIVLEMSINDYALSEIAQIVESNDAKVLSSYANTHPDNTKMFFTVKVNKEDLSPIIQTFQRYEYNIVATFQESEHLDDLKSRYESLMKFINI